MKILKKTIRDVSYDFKERANTKGIYFEKNFKFIKFNFDRNYELDLDDVFTIDNLKEIFYPDASIEGIVVMNVAHNELNEYIQKSIQYIQSNCSSSQAKTLFKLKDSLVWDFMGDYIDFNVETTYQHIPSKNRITNFPWNGCFILVEDYERNGLFVAIE